MPQINTRDILLLGISTRTTTGRGSDVNLPQGFTGAIITLDVQTVSGTNPTLDLKVQNKLPIAAATDTTDALLPTGTMFYDDLLAFSQVTTSTTRRIFRISVGRNFVEAAASDGALGAGMSRNGPLGGTWAVKFVIGGTTPSFALSVTAQMIP